MNVLISCPNLTNAALFLPYIHGVLKSYADQDTHLKENCHWLKPLYLVASAEELLREYDISQIDVLGLSCYVWNWTLQLELAAFVKKINPGCLLVVGGPHPKPDDPEFFNKHPDFDLVVKQEGEAVFSEILKRRLAGKNNFYDIPGVYQVGVDTKPIAPVRLKAEDLPMSPWASESETFKEIIKEIKSSGLSNYKFICAVYETNRGCPYHCVFCDWGGMTYSKITQLSESRIYNDIDWLSENQVYFIFSADANWGMFERDVNTSRRIAKLFEKNKYPVNFYYSPTKSSAKHLVAVAQILYDAGMDIAATLSIQHTDGDVLDAIDRKNLKPKDLNALASQYRKLGIPIWIQLILGCPGDTLQKWVECLGDLVDSNLDGNFVAFAFALLPNAPAAQPDYLKKWEIKTTISKHSSATSRKKKYELAGAENETVTSCKSYTENDWIEMWVAFHFINALHSFGLTRAISTILSQLGLVSRKEFYIRFIKDHIYEQGSLLAQLSNKISVGLRSYLNGAPQAYDQSPREEGSGLDYYLKWDEWLFVEIVKALPNFFEELTPFVSRVSKLDMRTVEDLITFQRNLIIDPSYKAEMGRQFFCRYNWLDLLLSGESRAFDSISIDGCGYNFSIHQSKIGNHMEEDILWLGCLDANDLNKWIGQTIRTSYFRRKYNNFALELIECVPKSLCDGPNFSVNQAAREKEG